MNTKFIASALIAAASFASVSAFAAGADGGIDTPQVSTVSIVSRADVRAEALAARKGPVTDSYQVDGGTAVAAAPAAAERKRADVRAEAVQTRSAVLGDSAPGRG
ncbi:MAG: DUF4148 domain-containing protein [Comamonadaceae bacterium]|nr:MAG: DUF4148 domain-containing protein [Comamonadaceae bacterium]